MAHGRQVDGCDAVQTVERQCAQFILNSLLYVEDVTRRDGHAYYSEWERRVLLSNNTENLYNDLFTKGVRIGACAVDEVPMLIHRTT